MPAAYAAPLRTGRRFPDNAAADHRLQGDHARSGGYAQLCGRAFGPRGGRMAVSRLGLPRVAAGLFSLRAREDKTIDGSGSYARSMISDKFVSAVISHESPVNGPRENGTSGLARPLVRPGRWYGNEAGSARARGCGSITDGPGRRQRGIRPKAGWHIANVQSRQPGQHVDP